ncbi:MAG: hypothetical protein IJ099_06800 [Alphaproteobacteria bacterium]|nr:hypothetical protein [Alphaproteobacteria bacterium]
MPQIIEQDVLQNLLNYLTEKGYPADCLLMNYKLGKYRADLVITNPETHVPLQIFAYLPQKDPASITRGKQQLNDFIKEAAQNNPDVIGYLLFAEEKAPFFEVVDPNTNKPLRVSAFDYKNLVQKGKSASENMLTTNKSKAVGNLKLSSNLLIIAAIIVLLLDIFNIVELTGYRLYIILMIAALIMLPYFESIKFANFELKQKDKKKQD